MFYTSFARVVRLIVVVSILFSVVPLSPTAAVGVEAREAVVEAVSGPLAAADNAPLASSVPFSTFNFPLGAFDSPLAPPPPAPVEDQPALELALRAEPESVEPGEVVTFTLWLSNTDSAAMDEVVVAASVPDGLHPVPNQDGWSYDAAAKRLSANVGALGAGQGASLSVRLRAIGPVDRLAELMVEARSGDELVGTASASTWVAQPTRAAIGPEGGVFESSDKRVRVELPGNAVGRAAELVYTPRMQRASLGGAALRFDLDLRGAQDGAEIKLSAPVTVTVNVSGLLDISLQPDRWPYLAYHDESSGEWVRVPARVDREAGALVAQVDHFSGWETGLDAMVKSGWRLLYNPPQVSTFSGAASYSYPIEVLPGRSGLQPQLALSYSSRRVDGITSRIQSDWAGLGWSVDTIEIARRVGFDGENRYDNEFTLMMNGTSYNLIKDSTSGHPEAWGRYVTQQHSALDVMRYNDCSDDGDCDCSDDVYGCDSNDGAPNLTGEYWMVRAPDGTRYTLGNTPDSEQVVSGMWEWNESRYVPILTNAEYAGHTRGVVASRWRVKQVQDMYGNTVEYQYVESSRVDYLHDGSCDGHYISKGYDAASYLSEIKYNGRPAGAPTEYDTIKLVRATRAHNDDMCVGNSTDAGKIMFWQTDYLNQIEIWRGSTLVRKYVLGFGVPNAENRLLVSITPYGLNGSGVLPATTFDYAPNGDSEHANKHSCWWNWNNWPYGMGNCPVPANANDWSPYHWDMLPWWQATFPYYRLQRVSNGYGGMSEFSYERDATLENDFSTPYSYVVIEQRTQDGMGHTAKVGYAYAWPCWDRNGSLCHNPFSDTFSKVLVGYQQATVTAYNYAQQPEAITVHSFHTGSWALAGREWRTQYKDGAGNLLRQVDNVWAESTVGAAQWVRLTRTDTTEYGGGNAVTQRVEYDYESTFGNKIAQYEHGNLGMVHFAPF